MTSFIKSSSFLRRLPAILLLLGTSLVPHAAQAATRSSNMWWTPEAVTVHGHKVDELLMFIFWLTLAIFIGTQSVYVYFLVKYRYRKGVKAVYSHGNNSLELVWTAIPAVVFVTLAIFSNRLWLQLRSPAPGDAIKIDVMAYQFGFHIRNPGSDKTLGKYSLEAVKKGDNNFGQDLNDPASFDDYQSENQLTIPINRPVNVVLRSQDVIHAFYVPEFRVYQDMVPGHEITWMWFVPDKVGQYTLACNQLCGAGHYNMQAKIDVLSETDYDKFVAESSQKALKAREEKQKAANTAQEQPAIPAAQVASVSVQP